MSVQPANTDTGVDYGQGNVPYTPPANYTPGSWLDPNRAVPSGQLNNPTQRNALEVERLLVSGQVQYKDLPFEQRRLFSDQLLRNKGYLTPGNTYDPDALKTLDQQFKELADQAAPGFKLPGWMKPLEWVGSKMYGIYSDYVSRPLSAGILYASQNGGNFGGHSWNDAWEAARYTSPTQAAYMGMMTDDELKSRGINRDDLVGTRQAVDQFFSHGLQSWVTGLGDFAVSWYADPLVIAGRGVGLVREATFKQPISALTKDINTLGYKSKGWTFDQVMSSGPMTNLNALTEKYISKYGASEAITRMTNEIPSFQLSRNGSGSRLASALVEAPNAAERSQIMRYAIGDSKVALGGELQSDLTGYYLRIKQSQQSTLTLDYRALSDAEKQLPGGLAKKAQLDTIADEVTKLEAQTGKLSELNSLWGTLDNLNFNSITTPLGSAARGVFHDLPTTFAKAGDRPRSLGGIPVPLGQSGKIPFTARLAYNGLYVTPIRFARSFSDVRPTHFLKLDDEMSHKALRSSLQDTPMISPEMRNDLVGRYIAASPAERPMVLQQIESQAITAMAARHGLDLNTANQMYRDFYVRRSMAIDRRNQYSTARMQDGTPVDVVDKAGDGSILAVSPVLSSQMADSWVMMDFKRMDKVMRQQGPVIQRLLAESPNLLDTIRSGGRVAGDTIGGIADTLNSTWKFTQLARLGYGPRAISDELLTQIAAHGAFSMMDRMGRGLKNAPGHLVDRVPAGNPIHNIFQGSWTQSAQRFRTTMFENLDGLVTAQTSTVRGLERDLQANNIRQGASGLNPSRRRQLRREASVIQSRIRTETESLSMIRRDYASMNPGSTMLKGEVVRGHGFAGPTAREGRMFVDPLSAERSMRMVLDSNSGVLGRSMRNPNANWGTVNAARDGEAAHTQAWVRDVNMQIRNDPLAMIRASNGTEADMLRFMSSTEGVAYKAESPFRMMTNQEIVERVMPHVDEYLPPTMVGREDLGRAIAIRDLTGDELKASIPNVNHRPDVHGEQLSYALGNKGYGGDIARVMENGMQSFYRVMNQLPAEYLSKNPLFAQLYRSHLQDTTRGITEVSHVTPRQYLRIENAARVRALRDVKRLTFNMDYESRAAHALRFVAPFFGAQMESWIRWAGVIADKPQVAAHFTNLWNMPMRSGMATTFDGDHVDGHGYATNSVTGEKYKVDKSKIYVNMPMPSALLGALGIKTGRGVDGMRIPLDSLNLVISGNPAFAPAWGPVVQIPASDFIKGGTFSPFDEGHWETEGFFKELGVLPFGPNNSIWDSILPSSAKRMGDSEDEFGSKYQQNLARVIAEEHWKFTEGQRETDVSLEEAMDRARKFSKFEMYAGFVLPFSAKYTSPLDFYTETYRKMRTADPENGATMFRDKYGDSAYMFMAQLSRNNAGIASDSSSVYTSRLVQGAVDMSDSEFAGDVSHILSGPYATGDFSSGAYYYQLNTPIQTGGTEKQREKIGAIEAIDNAHAQDGWYNYNKLMLPLQSELYRRGFKTFADKGAEDLAAQKKQIAKTLGSPTLNDGVTVNPYYNAQWAKDYQSLDPGKYDRFAANLEGLIGHPAYQGLALLGGRSDLVKLQDYLLLRKNVNQMLAGRASQNINAKSNADIKAFAKENTSQMIESDTRFNELHNRYFNRDLGWDQDLYDYEQGA